MTNSKVTLDIVIPFKRPQTKASKHLHILGFLLQISLISLWSRALFVFSTLEQDVRVSCRKRGAFWTQLNIGLQEHCPYRLFLVIVQISPWVALFMLPSQPDLLGKSSLPLSFLYKDLIFLFWNFFTASSRFLCNPNMTRINANSESLIKVSSSPGITFSFFSTHSWIILSWLKYHQLLEAFLPASAFAF